MPVFDAPRIVNLVIRGTTIASRFFFIFLLAKYLTPAELGLYGLFAAVVGYSIYPLGLDYYVITVRELNKLPKIAWGGLIKDHAVVSVVTYVVLLPVAAYLFISGYLPSSLLFWFLPIVILEHVNQELGRILTSISEQTSASIVLLFRSGVWAIIVAGLMFYDERFRSLDVVFGSWTVGGVIALCVAALKLTSIDISGWKSNVSWNRILGGLKIAAPFFVSTLCLRSLFFFDRYWFEVLAGIELLGVYVLFLGVTNVLMTLLEAGVFSFGYPALITAWHQKDYRSFRNLLQKMTVQTIFTAVAYSAILYIIIDYVFIWLGRPIYVNNGSLLFWVMASTSLYAVGMIPHYGLYAQGRDKTLIYSHVSSVGVFFIANSALSKLSPILSTPISLCVTFFVVFIWKYIALRNNTLSVYRREGVEC